MSGVLFGLVLVLMVFGFAVLVRILTPPPDESWKQMVWTMHTGGKMTTRIEFMYEIEDEWGNCDEVTCVVDIDGERGLRSRHPADDPSVESVVVRDMRGAVVELTPMQYENIVAKAMELWRELR